MGTIVAVEHLTLDGVMQSPGRPDEDTRGGFTAGGWASAALGRDPDARAATMPDGPSAAMLFGRRTYLDLVGHWLTTTEPNPFTDILRSTPKYVASRTLDEPLPHPSSFLIRGELPAAVAELKQSLEGDIVVLGSGDVVRQLAAAQLVDRYVLTIVPTVLGTGTRLFDGAAFDLDVTSSYVSPTGIVVLHADVVGAR